MHIVIVYKLNSLGISILIVTLRRIPDDSIYTEEFPFDAQLGIQY